MQPQKSPDASGTQGGRRSPGAVAEGLLQACRGHCSPWCRPEGGLSLRCRLGLSPPGLCIVRMN